MTTSANLLEQPNGDHLLPAHALAPEAKKVGEVATKNILGFDLKDLGIHPDTPVNTDPTQMPDITQQVVDTPEQAARRAAANKTDNLGSSL